MRRSYRCVRFLGSIALYSPSFSEIRAGGAALVDKTGAIADLLNAASPGDAHRVFFARPRKFGKSLTLSIAAEMLAVGPLPQGVTPWPGYAPANARALFEGLQVHERLLRGDASLGGLLQRPHFVVKLGLGLAQSGTELKSSIIRGIAAVAGRAFGPSLAATVASIETPGDALGALVDAVPASVPVALLVDEYDAAIIQDVADGEWASAKAGIRALRSLAMSTKSPHFGSRIERCLITGVARFSRTSLFSGANNFQDLTCDPLLSRVLGFSEAEIRATFPEELARLASSLGTDMPGALAQLARWYNGYCFDGSTTCFNPFPVLSALKAGCIDGRELEGASSYLWLGVPPATLLAKLGDEHAMEGVEDSIDIADIEAEQVHAAPLLLQTGLLTLQPRGAPASGAALDAAPARLLAPNEFARRTLRATAARLAGLPWNKRTAAALSQTASALCGALLRRDHAGFQAELHQSLSKVSARTTKPKMVAAGATPPLREAPYHTFLHGLLLGSLIDAVGTARTEVSSAQGDADIVVELNEVRRGGHRSAVWILEVGLGDADGRLSAKLAQGKRYAAQYVSKEVLVCAVLVGKAKDELKDEGFRVAWARRGAGEKEWVDL
jgi:hypothetical protein